MNENQINSEYYGGWNTNSHLRTFEFWNFLSNTSFNFMYGNFQENRFLIDLIRNAKAKSIVDVGCATGTTFRLIRNKCKKNSYTYKGFDISAPAIEYAKSKYKKNIFHISNQESFRNLPDSDRDVIFSRDTVMHQTEPFDFLRNLIKHTRKYLILRLRTRDKGKTVWDVKKSAQMHYDDFWMPYIVINTDELLNFILTERKPKSIKINKSYQILGGNNFRFLPKDLYFSSAKGSETSICIDFSETSEKVSTNIEYSYNLEGQEFLKEKRIQVVLLKMMDKFLFSGGQKNLRK